MLNAKDTEICANSDIFTPKASGLKHKRWPAIFRGYTVLLVEVRYSWRLILWPFWCFFLRKKMLCRQSYLTCPSFPIICGSEKQPMYGQVKQMILTGEYQRRTQLPGLQREANTKCFQPAFFLMAGKVWLFWLCWSLHNHKTVLGPICLWPQYTSLCPLCKANNEQNFPFDQLWSF